ncbi:hypothetical protein BZA77DRAFT_298669 [Pyronema omphalodes]|nr:hypothetical protein BZA77DRAFT_298669 [Pyronema omphalodes]
MGDIPCTVNCLLDIFVKPPGQGPKDPVVQCLQIKPIPAQDHAPERFRIVLSDTRYFVQAMIATQANNLIHSGELQRGTFLRLNSYNPQKVKDRRILIVTELSIAHEFPLQEKIGNPTALDTYDISGHIAAYESSVATAATATSFYGDQPPKRPTAAPARGGGFGGGAPAAKGNPSGVTVYPIGDISPYQNKWTIKARVVNKSEVKTWHNSKSEGKLFNVTLLDETGEIRATAFGQEVDTFYEVLQEQNVYYISKCRVNIAKKQFSNVKNDYELMIGRDTVIELCNDDSVPKMNYNFIRLADLSNVEKDAVVDVLGVVKEVGEVEDFVAKTSQKQLSKREISLVDESDTMVRCTVWGQQAKTWEIGPGSVAAFKGLKVSDFGGRTLSLTFSSTFMANPDIDEAHALKGWYDGQGNRDLSTFKTHAGLSSATGTSGRQDPIKTIAQVREENLGMNDQPDYFTTKATITYIKHDNVSYPACLTEGCNKKVVKYDDQSWRCEKCNVTHPKAQYRYIMTLSINDATGQAWLNCFDEVGRIVMGMSADDLEELRENNTAAHEKAFSESMGQTFLFRCKARQDTYNDTVRVRYQVMSISELNYAAEAAKLVEQIRLYSI